MTSYTTSPLAKADEDIDQLAEVLIDRGLIRHECLDQAVTLRDATGATLQDVLVAEGYVSAEEIAAAEADLTGLGYTDLSHDPPDSDLVRAEDLDTYLRFRILPWRRVGRLTAYVTADRKNASLALSKLEPEIGFAFFLIVSRPAFDQAMLNVLGPTLAERAARRTPETFSVRTLGLRRYAFLGVVVLLLGLFIRSPQHAMAALGLLLLVLSVATGITRLAALLFARERRHETKAPDGTVPLSQRRPLPRVSLLVPLFKEAGILRQLLRGLERLDYPRALLDVKLLLEEADVETRRAITRVNLPPWIKVLVLPDGAPQTKPRAMNLALDFCDGEIVGILDAEDRPDPGQLQSVAKALRDAPPDVACVQCQLTYFNASENWITRCFQIEYSIWFDVLLRGWERLGLPIPLGGTSVYFRKAPLVALGGWDAHNVTEDADLGMRLARNGYRCAVVTSTTQEEASAQVTPWIRQRSRWLKGYMMTWLSHMRDPRLLWKDLGPKGFFGFQILFLGGAASYLAMPLFWAALMLTLLVGQSVYGPHMPEWALMALGVSLVMGQGVMLAAAWVALWRRRMSRLALWVPTLVIYWTMGAAAAWKAVVELIAAPYFWDKTRHGVTRFLPGQRM